MLNDKLKNYLHFHVIVFIWGFTAVLGALITIDAVPLVWWRMGIASVLIFIFIKWKGLSLRMNRSTLLGLSLAGVVIAAHWLTFFGAIKVSNVSITLAMMSTGAFFTSLMEPLFYKRKIIGYELLFGLLVIGGLYLIFQVETEYTLGIVLALISAFLSAVFTLINGKYVQDNSPTVMSFYELTVGTLCIAIYLAFAKAYSPTFFALPVMDWVYLFILASVCTAYAFIASVKVMRYLSPYTLMLTINLEPVYGIILAYLLLGDSENMSPKFYLGGVLILSTVVLNGILKTRRKVNKVESAQGTA
ncbi:DMT family transporter [Croceiramulus getboli]|nr:DMT family transporter [Flavobacteriaceae bacterium YJPT1-3]